MKTKISQYTETLERIKYMEKEELIQHLTILYGTQNIKTNCNMAELRHEALKQTNIFFLYEEETLLHFLNSLLKKIKNLIPVFQNN